MVDDVALGAAAGVVASLAAEPQWHAFASPAPSPLSSIRLPGCESAGKNALEIELQKLSYRISQLETKTNRSPFAARPKTPNDAKSLVFDDGCVPLDTMPVPSHLVKKVTETLSGPVDDHSTIIHGPPFDERANPRGYKRKRIHQPPLETPRRRESIEGLKGELWKHQKANEAFHTALREIGEIITAVARGDLTMKVRMDTVELDPEITTFKRTINTMIDQLQTFASEVSRVAREVGTEGLLGGQAHIDGVDGTWKELTDNGISSSSRWYPVDCVRR